MPNKRTKELNGKWLTADQLERDATEIEENLNVVNKSCIIKMLKVLNSIINIIKRKDDGVFSVLLKWFRLYLKLYYVIDPDNKMLLKFYENTVPTIITYLIGCLQYKPKNVPNYHHTLLEILEELIESVQPCTLKKITKFEKETIGCLWTPIELAGDYNTQLKALRIFSILLKQFDENRQNEELNAIKWTNLNFFQEKLKAVVQATKLSHILENLSRELLNNYNMNLSKTLLVYSFHCVAVTFGKKYKFYKPLNIQKFWIDVNYCPKTLSFCGRFKLKSNSKYEIINIILKIQKITLINNTLQVYFSKPGEFSKYVECLSSEAANLFEFTLDDEEKERLVNNNYIIEYFNNLDESNSIKNQIDTFELLKKDIKTSLKANKTKLSSNNNVSKVLKNIENSQVDKSTSKGNMTDFDIPKHKKSPALEPLEASSTITLNLKRKIADESSKTSSKIDNEMELRPKRSVRLTNKFFKSFRMEESFDDLNDDMPKRKRKQKRKSRQTKSRCKQVCKVTPTVDLTKIEDMESFTLIANDKRETTTANDSIAKTDFSKVLKQVADIYEVADTAYAEPCQSYRNFEMHSNPIQKTTITKANKTVKDCKKKIYLENQSNVVKKRKFNDNSQENKENENPETNNTATILRPPSETKTIILPGSDEISPLNISKKYKSIENVLSSSPECEEVRGLNQNVLKDMNHLCTPDRIMMTSSSNATTPRPTSTMNVSNLSDSDTDITDTNNFGNRQHQRTNMSPDNMVLDMESIEHRKSSNFTSKPLAANNKENIVNFKGNCEIMDDFEDNSDSELHSKYLAPIKKTIADLVANHLPNIDYKRECIIFKNRHEDANSSDEDAGSVTYQTNCNKKKPTNNNIKKALHKPLILNQNLRQEKIVCTSPAVHNFQISSNLTTRTATKCQVTPTALIMHKIQVSAEKSIILKRKEPRKEPKANRCLNNVFANKELMQLQRKNTYNEKNYAPSCSKSLTPNTSLVNMVHRMEYDPWGSELQKGGPGNGILRDGKLGMQQQCSSTNSNLAKDCENNSLHCGEFAIPHEGPAIGDFNNSFRNDLFQILNNYNANINNRVDNILRHGIKNITDRYTLHFFGITKAVFQKAEENRLQLEEIRAGIGTLVRELEWQYDAFIKKSKEFDIHSEMCKGILENLSTIEIPSFITQEYEDIFKNIRTEQNVGFQNVWRNVVNKYKAKYV